MVKKETTYGSPAAAGGVAANHLTIKAHMMDFFALYLPSLALGIPSFLFALKQLYHSHPMDYDLNEVYTLFGPARINFCLSLFAMYLHIRTSSNMSR
jgi:hypothetical protein